MDFHKAATDSWETNASFWDEHVATDGNKYWKLLQEPALRRMISVRPDSVALDLATGNGIGARWLATAGCKSILATDASNAMLDVAKRRAEQYAPDIAQRISYQHLDLASPEAFEKLRVDTQSTGGFDIILMNMAIMDVSTLGPLAEALPKLLKPNGVFVATLLHPVFFTSGATRSLEFIEGPEDFSKPTVVRAKVIRQYLNVPPVRGVATFGQPAPQVYFHRPIHELFSTFFKTGLVMDAIEEPAFEEKDGTSGLVESHTHFTQLPAILAFRLRRL